MPADGKMCPAEDRSTHDKVRVQRFDTAMHLEIQIRALGDAEAMANTRLILNEERRKAAQRGTIARKLRDVSNDEGLWAQNQEIGEKPAVVTSRVFDGIFIPRVLQPKGPLGGAPFEERNPSSQTSMSRSRSSSGKPTRMARVNSRLWLPVAMPVAAGVGGGSMHGGGDGVDDPWSGPQSSVHGIILDPSGEQMWLERGDKSAKKMVRKPPHFPSSGIISLIA